jgi:hypothetical protein
LGRAMGLGVVVRCGPKEVVEWLTFQDAIS